MAESEALLQMLQDLEDLDSNNKGRLLAEDEALKVQRAELEGAQSMNKELQILYKKDLIEKEAVECETLELEKALYSAIAMFVKNLKEFEEASGEYDEKTASLRSQRSALRGQETQMMTVLEAIELKKRATVAHLTQDADKALAAAETEFNDCSAAEKLELEKIKGLIEAEKEKVAQLRARCEQHQSQLEELKVQEQKVKEQLDTVPEGKKLILALWRETELVNERER